MKTYDFHAELVKKSGMNACYILFPYDVEEEFGTRGQVKVKAIFDGKVEYRGSLANMGMDAHCLGVTKKIRDQLEKSPGETIHVSLHKDTEPRTVEIPTDLTHELRLAGMEETFKRKSYSQQKKFVEGITNAKKDETRSRRVGDVIQSLKTE